MNNFYTAVEGKKFRGLPVYKFTGERWGAVGNYEVDFEGRFTPDMLSKLGRTQMGYKD